MPEFLRTARNLIIATLLAWLGFSQAPADPGDSQDQSQAVRALLG